MSIMPSICKNTGSFNCDLSIYTLFKLVTLNILSLKVAEHENKTLLLVKKKKIDYLRPCLCSSTALCFTCAWYSSIVTGGLLHLLAIQLINISYNVTEREARIALREKTARSAYWGLVVNTGTYSRGFRGNWSEFMSMGDKVIPPSPTDLV